MPKPTERDLTKQASAMLDQAMQLPGVTAALKVYEAAARHAHVPTPEVPAVRFSTGGNA